MNAFNDVWFASKMFNFYKLVGLVGECFEFDRTLFHLAVESVTNTRNLYKKNNIYAAGQSQKTTKPQNHKSKFNYIFFLLPAIVLSVILFMNYLCNRQ